jgi:hypothetical protein
MSRKLTPEERAAKAAQRKAEREAEKRSRADTSWHAAFIAVLKETGGNVSEAADAVEIHRQRAYEHKKLFPDFADQWADAEAAGLEELIKTARTRAKAGSDLLLMFLIKKYDPSFRDNYQPPPAEATKEELSASKKEREQADRELMQWRENTAAQAQSYAAMLSSLASAAPTRPTSQPPTDE